MKKVTKNFEVNKKYETTVGKVLIQSIYKDTFDDIIVIVYKKMEMPIKSTYRYGATSIENFAFSYLLATFPERVKQRSKDIEKIINNTITNLQLALEQ